MNNRIGYLIKRNLLFWLSRKIDYPLVPPDVVQMNFTFDCNLRCKMCSMHEQKESLLSQGRQVDIDSDALMTIMRGAKDLGAKAVLFIGGEPFLRNDLFDLVKYAKNLGLASVIVTNGVLLNKENIEKSFNAGLEWLSISIDAASENTFRKIRGKNTFDIIINNLKNLNAIKEKERKEWPKAVAVCTIMNDNLEELSDVVYLCKELKIERVLFQPVVANNIDQAQRIASSPSFVTPDRFKILDTAIDKLIEYKKYSPSNYDFIANNIVFFKLVKKYFRGTVKYWQLPCYAGYNRVQIVQEGKLYFCVNQKKYIANFGDVKNDSLRKLWFSKEAKFYRKLIRKCKFPCLQWCAYRDEFIELSDIWQKTILFKNKR